MNILQVALCLLVMAIIILIAGIIIVKHDYKKLKK
jgi:uncharacterized protein YoxC